MKSSAVQTRRPEASVRTGTSTPIPALLQSFGLDPAVVLAEVGVDVTVLDDPDNRMSLATHNRLVAHCAARAGCPHFGLLVGQRDGLGSLGLVGLLVKHSADVESALAALARHLQVHVHGASVRLSVTEQLAMLTWDIYEPGLPAVEMVGDGAIAVFHNILHELCGPEWRAVEVRLARRMPEDPGPYRRFFRVPMRFDADEFALLFPRHWLAHRLPPVDAAVLQLLRQAVERHEEEHRGGFPDQVRGVLRAALATGRSSVDDIAALFGMNGRTLARRLHTCGTSFQQLLDETRFEIARQLLEESAMDVGRIAELLGYASHGAFTRAFQRWTGRTPVECRSQHRRGA